MRDVGRCRQDGARCGGIWHSLTSPRAGRHTWERHPGHLRPRVRPSGVGNALYGLPNGPLIPGMPPAPRRDAGPRRGAISDVDRAEAAQRRRHHHELPLTRHWDRAPTTCWPSSRLTTSTSSSSMKRTSLQPSPTSAYSPFHRARSLLMSACFQRLDGKPIDAESSIDTG